MEKLFEEQVKRTSLLETSLKNMEVQMGQMAQEIHRRPQGGLPSDTVPNPKGKEQCHAVTLRSGKNLKDSNLREAESSRAREEQHEQHQPKENDQAQQENGGAQEIPESWYKDDNQVQADKEEAQQKTSSRKTPELSTHPEKEKSVVDQTAEKLWNYPGNPKPTPPYPVKSRKVKDDKKDFAQFVKTMKKVNMEISMFDLFTSMPKYPKFLKEMVTNKEKFTDDDVVEVSATTSSFIKPDDYMPPKLKDPGSCTIQCNLGGRVTYKALCDQGSGVNLMPLSIAHRLNLLDGMKPTQVTLQLADRSLVKPTGVIEDICVGVGKLILPADFIILDAEEDKEVPLILGRPFMATGNAWLGVKDKVVIFQVNGEQVIFNLDKAIKRPRE